MTKETNNSKPTIPDEPPVDDRRFCEAYVGNPCYDQKVEEEESENATDNEDKFLSNGEFFD